MKRIIDLIDNYIIDYYKHFVFYHKIYIDNQKIIVDKKN